MRQYFVDQAMEVDPREAKLPVWAQNKLVALRRATSDARGELQQLKTGSEPGPFWLESWDDNERFYLPKYRGVLTFGDPATGRRELQFSQNPQAPDGWLYVTGDDSVIAAPWAANVMLLKGHDVTNRQSPLPTSSESAHEQ